MADNVELNAGSGGQIVATDQVGGFHYQYVKPAYGADGTATIVTGSIGLPVHLIQALGDPIATNNGISTDGALRVCIANDGNVVNTELPAAAVLADTTANPTVPLVGSAGLLFNGTTWDRIRGDTTNGLDVDVTRLPAIPAGANNIGTVELSATALAALETITVAQVTAAIPAGDNNIGNVDIVTVPTDPFGANADAASATGSISAKLRFVAATGIPITSIAAGDTNIGNVDIVTLPALVTGSAVIGHVGLEPRTSGGVTNSKTISAATTNATSVKASAGQVFGIFASNIHASPRYLKLYDKASSPVVGTDVPVATYLIPGNTAGTGFRLLIPHGLAFAAGIALALTTGVADADTGAVAANDIVVNLEYK